MFTTGRIAFVIFFVIVFIAMLVWSYGKEKKLHSIHFKRPYKVLIAIILFVLLQFVIVKLGGFI